MTASAVKLGLMPPLTGLVGIYGEEISRAAAIACREINETGGILGRELELVIEDDGSLPESAVAAATRLVDEHRCTAIIGNLLSNSRIAVAYRVAEPRRIPYLNFSFYEGSILSRYFFHFAALPNQQIDRMIPYMRGKFGPRMFFAGNAYEWPRGSIAAARSALSQAGGEVAGEKYLKLGLAAQDIDALLDRVAAAAPDVFVPYFAGDDQLRVLTRFTERGLKSRMAVVMGHFDEVMASRLPPEVREGLYSSNTYFMSVDTPENRQLLAQLAAWPGVAGVWPKGNGIVTNFGEGAYLCVKAFATAARRAGTLDTEAIVEALADVELTGPQGKVHMDPASHHARVNTWLTRCEADGSFTVVESFGAIAPVLPERYRHQAIGPAATLEDDFRLQARVLAAMSEAVLLVRADDLRIVYANPGAQRLFGYEPGELLGRLVGSLIAPDDQKESNSTILAALVPRGAWQGEIRNVRKDGSVFWSALSISTFTHPVHGEVWLSVQSDISERKALQMELDRHRHHLEELVATRTAEVVRAAANTRQFVRQAPVAIAMFDRDMNYLASSDRWVADYGRGHTDLVGLNHYDIHPDLPAEWKSVHQRGLAGETVRSDADCWIQADASRHWLRWAVQPWTQPNGDIGGIIMSAEDMTAAMLAAEALRESEERLRLALGAAQAGAWRWEVPSGEIYWSPENFRLHDMDPAGASPTYAEWETHVHPDDLAASNQAVRDALEGRTPEFRSEFRLIRPDGGQRWLLSLGHVERGAEGAPLRMTGINLDITNTKTLEAGLIEARNAAQRLAQAKSEFLANMSHEIRTPLHIIIGLAHLLRRDMTDPGALQRLDQLNSNSDHLLGIINDILDLSRIEAGQTTLHCRAFDLATVIEKVEEMLRTQAQAKALDVSVAVAPAVRALRLAGDALRLTEVLINLLGNAVKFTPSGSVRLAIDQVADSATDVTLHFGVADTGIGIAAADQARLFQPFMQADASSTRRHGGTGLGLAISQRLVALMGGNIDVVSAPGAGSLFGFALTLPRAGETAEELEPTVIDLEHRQVLLVEDHPLSQEIMFEMLEDMGCDVDVAGDGLEAVDCARRGAYDLILMDVQLPGMDGLAATRAIRALPRHASTPIVALTANAFSEDRQRCLDAGMNGHIGKPVTPESLSAGLGQWLPGLAREPRPMSSCDGELSRALAAIPGLEPGFAMLGPAANPQEQVRLLGRFVDMHCEDMSRLRQHLDAGERDAARRILHDLQGVAPTIGARRIGRLAHEISLGLRADKDAAELDEQITNCAVALSSLDAAVRALPKIAADAAASPR